MSIIINKRSWIVRGDPIVDADNQEISCGSDILQITEVPRCKKLTYEISQGYIPRSKEELIEDLEKAIEILKSI